MSWERRTSELPNIGRTCSNTRRTPVALQGDIEAHLKVIQEFFDKYFSALDHAKKWIRHPFAFDVDELPDDDTSKELWEDWIASLWS